MRVVEVADETGEYCGLLLAGLGAEVIKVEPPGGSPTRRIGPFRRRHPDPERSLYFWHYNRGKRSVVLDLESAARARALLRSAARRRRPARFDAAARSTGNSASIARR